MFICDKCGLCCMHVGESELYRELDRGDGICLFFDEDTHLCTIYDERPLLCNVDKSYKEYFEKYISLDDYYKINYECCKKLKGDKKECIYQD